MADTHEFRRRKLPHWDVPGAIYFITTCLEGSIPARGLSEIAGYRADLAKQEMPADLSEDEWQVRQSKLVFARTDEWLDTRSAVRWLADPNLADVVSDTFHHFAGDRYDVFALVVMPSHLHWVFRPRVEWVATLAESERTPREVIMQSVKRYSGRECNKLLGRSGPFWQAESYDHWARDEDELLRMIHYVEQNPVKAGLVAAAEDWKWSTARLRKGLGLRPGQVIPRPSGVGTGF